MCLGCYRRASTSRGRLAAGRGLGSRIDPATIRRVALIPFPFPAATEAQQQAIRDLAEQLDAHRKRVLAVHQDLTLTGLYNVLEKLRAGEALTEKERDIHERGLVSVMKHLHEQIDAAVFDAYGWPRDLSDEEILARLVELNKERRAEEAKGLVRWLRPEYQAPAAKKIVVDEQGKLDIAHVPSAAKAAAQGFMAEDFARAGHHDPRPVGGAAQARASRGAGAPLPACAPRRRAGGAERARRAWLGPPYRG